MAPKYSRSGYQVSDVMSLSLTRRCTMLKPTLAAAALLALCTLPLAAQQQKPAANAGNDVTLTGQVIDVNCYTTMGASGPAHKQCAAACAKAGVALAILSSDGTIYMPVSSKPADAQNSRLEPFAEGQGKGTGGHRKGHGEHTVGNKAVAARWCAVRGGGGGRCSRSSPPAIPPPADSPCCSWAAPPRPASLPSPGRLTR